MADFTKEELLGLYKKISKVQQEVGSIAKTGYNQLQKYGFVVESDVVSKIKDILLNNDLIAVPSLADRTHEVIEVPSKIGKNVVTQERLTYILSIIDVTSGCSMSVNFYGTGSDYAAGDKAIYKAITGASKYALMKTFMLEINDGKDAENEDPRDRGNMPPQPKSNEKAAERKNDIKDVKDKLAEMPDALRLAFKTAIDEGKSSKPEMVKLLKSFNWDWVAIDDYIQRTNAYTMIPPNS